MAEKKGRIDGLCAGIGALCEVLGLELGPSQRAQLGALDVAGLEALLARIRTERRWH